MKNSDYWKKRFTVLEAASHSYGQQTYSRIEKSFTQAQRDIQGEIDKWYARFAQNNGVTLADAKHLLNAKELSELKWDVNQYIQYGRENAIDGRWAKQLENASARFHITRLEALQLRTQQAMEAAFGNELDEVDKMARHVLTDDYYHSIFEVQKGFNIGWNIGQLNERELDKLVVKPWSTDGKNFSDRIWQRKTELVSQLHQELTRTLIQGKSPNEAIKHMEQFVDGKVKNAKYAASRLVMTEQAYFHSVSQQKAFEELDVEEFEIIAVLDSHTSEVCQQMDGKHFPMKDYEAGVTAPPFHPNCRSVTAPYFEDNYGGMRAARDEDGKTYYVPDNMTYKDWKKTAVDGEGLTNGGGSGIIKNTALGKALTPNEEYEENSEAIHAALHNVETERRELDYEVGTIIDRQGNVINVTSGEAHSVSLPDELLADNIFTHNHPSGGCFSAQDIKSMVEDDVLELRASTPQGTYFSLLRKPGVHLSDHELQDFYTQYKQATGITKATEAVRDDMKVGKLTKAELDAGGFNIYVQYMSKMGIQWLEEFADSFGYIFTQGVI